MQRYREPEFLPWDGRRVPITFVGGYLGAGKTTAINELLASTDRPIAVIVNDVGSVDVDAKLIRRRHGDTIELTDGCVCCSSIDGIGAAFDQIRSRAEPPDHVLVELSGVAEPSQVVWWGTTAGFRLDGVVVVAAADQLGDPSLPPWIRERLDRQIAAADLLVLTKTDLVDDGARSVARARLAGLAPRRRCSMPAGARSSRVRSAGSSRSEAAARAARSRCRMPRCSTRTRSRPSVRRSERAASSSTPGWRRCPSGSPVRWCG